MIRLARSLCLAVLLVALAASTASAATLVPLGGTADPDEFSQPIFVTSDPVDSSRLFVVEREGRVAEVDGEDAPRLYADLTGLVSCCGGEQGLFSIALAPDFDTSGRFYAAYAGKGAAGGSQGDIHVDSFIADADGDVARTPILSIVHNEHGTHYGGQLQFGPDGHLYISTGDGGGGGDPAELAQNLNALLGKVLRIDPEPGSTPAYSIPPGNPFASGPGADEIWAYGLRNPWRFSFDSLAGDMVIGDVGQNTHEEVDFAPSPSAGVVGGAGANYGWSCREGFSAYTDASPTANCAGVSGFTEPVFDYPHSGAAPGEAGGCSITGGYVVRDASLGDLYGRYLYADYCEGEIRSLALPSGATPVADRSEGLTAGNPVSFGEDSCHRLYVATGSTVYRFEGTAAAVCPEPPGEEEPPDEEPPGNPPPGETPPPKGEGQPLAPTLLAPRDSGEEGAEVQVGARRRGDRLLIAVGVAPCPLWAGAEVQLNRGGEEVGRKRLNRACAAVFRRPPARRATFRALLRSGSGEVLFRSERLLLAPPLD